MDTAREGRPDQCPACAGLVALDDQGRIRWHQHADTPEGAYHLLGCAGADQATTTGVLAVKAADEAPRYTWIVRDGGDDPWILLGYRWTSRKDALGTADHWLHHHEQVKTVEVAGDGWTAIETGR